MTKELQIEDVLEYAISLEQRSVILYTDLAAAAKNDALRKVFLGFAEEEMGHRKKLEDVLEGAATIGSGALVNDMQIAEHVETIAIGESTAYQDILLFAMQQEKQAFRLYTDLSERIDVPELKALFEALAQEEAKHKLRFEIEYDEHILTDN